jgi:lipopolysaccharide export LptBFGC system permease protein LptF
MLMLFEQWGVDPLVSLVLVTLLAALVCAFAAYWFLRKGRRKTLVSKATSKPIDSDL